jgi:hypothetical protein
MKLKFITKNLKLPRKRKRYLLLIALGLVIILTPLAIYLAKNPQGAAAGWWDDGWQYRKKITFGNSGTANTHKKVKFDIDTATLITAGKLQSDCDDIRFTDENGVILSSTPFTRRSFLSFLIDVGV